MRKLCLLLGLLTLLGFATSANEKTFSTWSDAVLVPNLNTTAYNEGCPFISKNGLDLYFRTNEFSGNATHDIYVSHRESVDDPWEEPISLGSKINTPADETCSFVTIDGHWLFFARKDATTGYDIWVSHRKNKREDQGWEAPIRLSINSAKDDHGPCLFEDEATGRSFLYFASNVTGNADIYVSEMVSEDKTIFSTPVPVTELNTTPANELHPFVQRKDGLEIIFISTRAGSSGQDLWTSTRPTTSDPWSTPVNLTHLNSAANELKPSLSWDGTTLYFCSGRLGGTYPLDLYMATRMRVHD